MATTESIIIMSIFAYDNKVTTIQLQYVMIKEKFHMHVNLKKDFICMQLSSMVRKESYLVDAFKIYQTQKSKLIIYFQKSFSLKLQNTGGVPRNDI